MRPGVRVSAPRYAIPLRRISSALTCLLISLAGPKPPTLSAPRRPPALGQLPHTAQFFRQCRTPRSAFATSPKPPPSPNRPGSRGSPPQGEGPAAARGGRANETPEDAKERAKRELLENTLERAFFYPRPVCQFLCVKVPSRGKEHVYLRRDFCLFSCAVRTSSHICCRIPRRGADRFLHR